MKFLSFLAATVCAVAGVTNAQTTNTTAPLPACLPLNFTASKTGVATLNSGLVIAKGLGLFSKLLSAYDPLAILNNRLDAIPFSILGTDFTLTPVIKQLNATGISTLGLRPLNVTSDRGLALGLDFNGSINVDATFAFEIAQLNHQWWQICWTNILQPAKCPPAAIDVVLGVGLVKPTVDLNITLDYLQCPKTAPKGTCTDITASGILIDAINNKLISTTFPKILRKTVAVGAEGLSVNVESLSKLQFTLPAAGSLLAALGQRILGWTADEVNKKGSLYNDVVKIVNDLGKTLVNQLFSGDLAASFGANCYNA